MSFDTDPREYECPNCNEYEKERIALTSQLEKAENIAERIRDYALHSDTGFSVIEWIRLDAREYFKNKEAGE